MNLSLEVQPAEVKDAWAVRVSGVTLSFYRERLMPDNSLQLVPVLINYLNKFAHQRSAVAIVAFILYEYLITLHYEVSFI